jgi:glycine cleavage system transcriptional repressor
MKPRAVLSALGRDRVGVADDLAAALTERKIDIEDSRLTALKGQFAFIVQVCGDDDSMTGLQRDLPKLGDTLGYHLQMELIGPARPLETEPRFLIESYSQGPSGIGALTGVLKRNHINIEDLQTESAAASFTSKITFHMKARITIPSSCSIATLREQLRELERDWQIDILIKPLPYPVGEYA